MNIQVLARHIFRLRPSGTVRLMSLISYNEAKEFTDNNPKENSHEYSCDGEKIDCGLEFTEEGNRTKEEIAFILESARAKAFAESTNRVVNVKTNGD